jgi:hypothetical protein
MGRETRLVIEGDPDGEPEGVSDGDPDGANDGGPDGDADGDSEGGSEIRTAPMMVNPMATQTVILKG